MKKPHFYYDMTKETYNYVTNGVLLRESKKEKTILDMCLAGKTIKEISNITGYSTSTISNRKREIYQKIEKFLNEKDLNNSEKIKGKIFGEDDFKIVTEYTDLYKVYLLTFPNNKFYVGITSQDEKNRWKDGNGYIKNEFMYNDILKYGWKNIKKNILYKDLLYEEAREKEKELIIHYKSHLKKYGYNNNF